MVTEYKDHIDKLLTETQKAHEAEKEKYNDIIDSCVAMKQQTAICQVIITTHYKSPKILHIHYTS